MKENIVTRKTLALLKDKGIWARKIHGNEFMAGFPDILAIHEGRTCWGETKRPPSRAGLSDGGRLSKLQVVKFREMLDHGAVIFVSDDAITLAGRMSYYLLTGEKQNPWFGQASND